MFSYRRLAFAVALSTLVCLPAPAIGQTTKTQGSAIAVNIGLFDIFQGTDAIELGADYRFPPQALGLVPNVGLQVTGDEALFAFLGVRRDFTIARGWEITPSFSVGAYEQGDGKDLGRTLEFRSGLEFSRRIGPRSKLSIGYFHISNASLSDVNPGVNSGLVTYVFERRRN